MLWSQSWCVAARMLSWVVKVVPQPPEILPKKDDDQKAKPVPPPVSVSTTSSITSHQNWNLGKCLSVNISSAGETSHLSRRSQAWRQEPGFSMVLFCSGLSIGSCSLETHLLFLDSPKKWQTKARGSGSRREQVRNTKTRINTPVITRCLESSATQLQAFN